MAKPTCSIYHKDKTGRSIRCRRVAVTKVGTEAWAQDACRQCATEEAEHIIEHNSGGARMVWAVRWIAAETFREMSNAH
jgi:hypothetical protein